MTHEGRMSRGEAKLKQGVTDKETEYFLSNSKPKEEPKEEPVKPKGKK